jgi:hypothetical protein
MNRCKHQWLEPRQGGYHPGYCTTNGAHLMSRCAKCGTTRVDCPQHKGYYIVHPIGDERKDTWVKARSTTPA